MNTEYDIVHLADNEWGNDLMHQVARAWFAEHPTRQFVEVWEHGGWWMCFVRQGSLVIGVGSASVPFSPFQSTPQRTSFSGVNHRRTVQRPDIKEVTDLKQYEEVLA